MTPRETRSSSPLIGPRNGSRALDRESIFPPCRDAKLTGFLTCLLNAKKRNLFNFNEL